jgi:small-conductance mechanosensitive channel
MKREDLISWGLTDEQVKKVMAGLDGDFVTKTRFNEANEENKTLKQSVSDRDKQLNDLKKSSGGNAELKAQIEELQKKNTEQAKAHAAEMAQLKLDNAVDTALTAAGAKNSKAVKALLDMSKVKLGEDGKLSGWDEQISAVQKSDSYLFNAKQPVNKGIKGFNPGKSDDVKPGTKVDMSKMSLEELTAYIEANPDAAT